MRGFVSERLCDREVYENIVDVLFPFDLSETAKIIPAMYGRWRQNKLYDPYRDIRRNLFHHYSANQIVHRPG